MLHREVEELLALCVTEQPNKPMPSSDYNRFLRFCNCVPLFYGHPIRSAAQDYLKRYFDSDLPIIPQNAEKLWILTADKLQVSNKMIPRFSIDDHIAPSSLPLLDEGREYHCLDAESLCRTDALTWNAWRTELQRTLDNALAKHRLSSIGIEVGALQSRQRPTLYHVEQALQRNERDESDCKILRSQVLRFVCEYAKELGIAITVTHCMPHTVELLAHYHRSMGLPFLICVTEDDVTRDALVELIRTTSAPIRLGVNRRAYPSQTTFESAVVSLAKTYPLGCLTVLENGLQKHFLLS